MKRIIFTTYDDLDRGESVSSAQKLVDIDFSATRSSDIAKQKLIDEYFDRLVQNKEDYANSIGVDFVCYRNTMQDFELDVELEFAKVNLYKHHLMAMLAEDYDEVCYVDMDVVFNTDENIFEVHDLSKGIHVRDQDEDIISKDKTEILYEVIGLRSPTIKYHITKDLLGGGDNHVMNTGIMVGRSEHIRQIRFIERTKEVIPRIEKLKERVLDEDAQFSMLTMSYYPNNESLFSYILEEYNIPYVLLDKEWHVLYGDTPKEGCSGKCIHFINKQFGRFFKDKTKAIFSLHIDIPTERLDNPSSYKDNPENKSAIAKRMMNEYRDRLIQNHEQYARRVGAEYIHFGRDKEYEEFSQRFQLLSEYDIVNLYKIWLLDRLTKEYDLVCYVDFDCVFRGHSSIFEHMPCNTAICVYYDTKEDLKINDNPQYFTRYKKDFRNPEAKYWNAHALLTEEGYSGENHCYNTGVIVASRYGMESLDYFGDIDSVLETMKDLKESSMYPPNIQKSFGYDNESIFSYKVQKNGVLVYRLQPWWHSRHYYDNKESFDVNSKQWHMAKQKYEARCKKDKAVVTHFISKNFSLAIDILGEP